MAKSEGMDKLKDAGRDLFGALSERAVGTISDTVSGLTDKLGDIAEGGPVGKAVAEGGKQKAEGGSAVGGALKGAVSGIKDKVTGGGGGSSGGSGGGKPTKSTNIIETIDVGVPVTVAYNQWTEFGTFPTFMKKVESVQAEDETKINFKAQIFWSHRSWEATIREQVPDERIVWRSKGQKGHVDGAVTFHEIGPNLTRILVVLEYYPKGLFEKTGNIWEAQGRRARAELRHFRRHVMTRTILDPDEVEGWRGVIHDGEVVQSHDEVVEEEEAAEDEDAENESSEDESSEDESSEDDAEYEGDDEAEYEDEDEAPEDDEEEDVPEDEEEDVPEDEEEDVPEDEEEDVPEDEEEDVPEDEEEDVPEDEEEDVPEDEEEDVPEDEEEDVPEDEEEDIPEDEEDDVPEDEEEDAEEEYEEEPEPEEEEDEQPRKRRRR